MKKNNATRKIKITNKENGEIFLDYGKEKSALTFRYGFYQSVVCNTAQDVTLVIDTNQRVPEAQGTFDEAMLRALNLRYAVVPTQADAQMFFGFRLHALPGVKKASSEHKIIIEITGGSSFPAELMKMIAAYDVTLGMGRKVPFDQIVGACQAGGDTWMFNPCFFEDSLYDSVICARMRSTFHLEQYIEAVYNEVAL